MDYVKAWWAWLRDRGSHSYGWAFLMALASADLLVIASSDRDGLQRWLDIGASVLFAKYAHGTWHRAEERQRLRADPPVRVGR